MTNPLRERLRRIIISARAPFRRLQADRNYKRYVRSYVAVTGSCGKTTTTTLIGALLSKYRRTATGAHDNAGLLILNTVRRLRGPVDFLVQETSGHFPGAIDLTTSRCRIDVAVVTSIGFDHGSAFRAGAMDVRDAIAQEKGKLVEAVAPGGMACLNFDDPRVRAMASYTNQKVVGFGTSVDADLRGINVDARWPGRLCFDLVVDGRTYAVRTQFVGTMMLTNVLAALSVVHGLGFELETAIEELATIEPVPDRMGVHIGKDSKTYILDTEKAPYWSTELLVQDLPRMAIQGLTFVIGDLSDIRSNSSAQYRKMIRSLSTQVATLVLAGRAAEYGEKLAGEIGFEHVVVAPTALDIAKYLDRQSPGVVLLKSNKTLQLWRVLDLVATQQVLTDAEGSPSCPSSSLGEVKL